MLRPLGCDDDCLEGPIEFWEDIAVCLATETDEGELIVIVASLTEVVLTEGPIEFGKISSYVPSLVLELGKSSCLKMK